MGKEVRVVLRFPGSTEVRLLGRPPRRGQRVESASGNVWFVSDVLASGVYSYTVTCVAREEFMRDLRARSTGQMAADLLASVRRVIPRDEGSEGASTVSGSGARRKERRYIATFVGGSGEPVEHHAHAHSLGEAEREAREAALRLGMRLLDVRLAERD